MPHETPLISTIVAGLGLAFVFGAIANRIRLPPLVGYLFAGVLIGPFTPGFVADLALAPQLAELGVILLMFGVGLHFSLKDLLSVRAIAVPGAIVQIGMATVMGIGFALVMGWTPGEGLVFGLALSVASTVVLLRAMQERRLIETERGRIAVGWLIVEDMAMILTLILLPAVSPLLGGQAMTVHDPVVDMLGLGAGVLDLAGLLLVTLAKVAVFVALMLLVGGRVIPWILHSVAHSGSRELFRLAVLAIALGTAFGAATLFGVSLALGAFFAGMIMSESELSHQAAQETLPLRDAFSVLFFVAMGMLFDPYSLIENPVPIVITLIIIVFGKSLAAFLIVFLFRYPATTGLTISASLAQIGEFSFILSSLGVELGLLPRQGQDLIVAGALLSILVNPLMFAMAAWGRHWIEGRSGAGATMAAGELVEARVGPEPAASLPPADDPVGSTSLTDHVVLIGYGRVGARIGEALKAAGQPFVVIEDADRAVKALKKAGIETIVGNAAGAEALKAANVDRARDLVVAIPNTFEAAQVVEQARATNPALRVVARAQSESEAEYLTAKGADMIIVGDQEIARGMVEEIEQRKSTPEAEEKPAKGKSEEGVSTRGMRENPQPQCPYTSGIRH